MYLLLSFSTNQLHSNFQAAILFLTGGPLVDQMLIKKSVFAFNYTPMVLGFIVFCCGSGRVRSSENFADELFVIQLCSDEGETLQLPQESLV
ncbi:hypothetical protein PIB30_040573 [Stylosanthes scabra]|uniref:Uncharacterized protein n=1 Tax=Stylosanthes scabra TaxID=79078 RepID=A0ABU6YFF6_9FABA|nr:hypothetical protein [Stylosanthes scabra]